MSSGNRYGVRQVDGAVLPAFVLADGQSLPCDFAVATLPNNSTVRKGLDRAGVPGHIVPESTPTEQHIAGECQKPRSRGAGERITRITSLAAAGLLAAGCAAPVEQAPAGTFTAPTVSSAPFPSTQPTTLLRELEPDQGVLSRGTAAHRKAAAEAREAALRALPDRTRWQNGQFLGALRIEYQGTPEQIDTRPEWDIIDRYYRTRPENPLPRHPAARNPNTHIAAAASRNERPEAGGLIDEKDILANGFMVHNDPDLDPNLWIVGVHDVTPGTEGVIVNGQEIRDPLFGLNAPIVLGDKVRWYYLTDDGSATEFEFTVQSVYRPEKGEVQNTDEAAYAAWKARRYTKPTMLLYTCWPPGHSDYRAEVTAELTGVARQGTTVSLPADSKFS